MRSNRERWLGWFLCVGLLAAAPPVSALNEDEAAGFERTPPRLSFTDGEVSFWRSGAEDWTPARTNIALAPGDELWTSEGANLELQVDGHTYVRAGEDTQIGLMSLEPDYVQLRVTTGHVSLDLRSRKVTQTIEIATPNAAFSIEQTGYYRVEVDGETTTLISRRGGRATVSTATGETLTIAASEQAVLTGIDAPQVETYAAPELDAWDRWNYDRTDHELDAVSARYVSSGVYGVDDLDHFGDWRVVPTYGAVWVPSGVAVGWAPYSTGRWMYDPFYGWTWVDDLPWGWAPYHYGRWVNVSGFWGWAPGPILVRPYYAPALVAFYGGGGGFSFSASVGPPYLGWVALGWGEPLIPWWGPVGCRGVPHWTGWRGPRVVNNVVVNNTTIINAREVNLYQNARVKNAIVAVDRAHFGRGETAEARVAQGRVEKLAPVHDIDLKPDRASFVAANGKASAPPKDAMSRGVVATREARDLRGSEPAGQRAAPETQLDKRGRADRSIQRAAPAGSPPARIVTPKPVGPDTASERPPFGTRSETVRQAPPPTPGFRDTERASRRGERALEPGANGTPSGPDASAARTPPSERPQPGAVERSRPSVRPREEAPPTPPGVERNGAPSGAERGSASRGIERGAPRAGVPPIAPPEAERGRAPRSAERGGAPAPPRAVAPPEAEPRQGGGRAERAPAPPRIPEIQAPRRELPGEPANRVFQPPPQNRVVQPPPQNRAAQPPPQAERGGGQRMQREEPHRNLPAGDPRNR
jgi:hypothetical protein